MAGSVASSGTSYWTITCADHGDATLFRLDIPASPSNGRSHEGDFSIGDCATQAINLYTQPRASDDASPVWVDAVSIRHL
jgi:hypothetical protein